MLQTDAKTRRPAVRSHSFPLAEALEGRALMSAALVFPHTYAKDGEIEFAVKFSDPDGIDPASVIGNDAAVSVALESLVSTVQVRYVGIDDTSVGGERTAIYRATVPPGAIVITGTRGVVSVQANQVRDSLGNALPAEVLAIDAYDLPADLSDMPAQVPANVQGTLLNEFTVEGRAETTPLALRRVFADADADSVFDTAEASALTDLEGAFQFFAQPGTVVRAEMPSDWVAATGPGAPAPIELSPNRPELRVSMAAPVVIDLLIAYAGVATGPGFGDMNSIRERAHDLVAGANRFYANSDTNTRLDLAGVLPVWYPSNGNAKQDLTRLRSPRDGALDEVHFERDRVGADVVVLIPSPEDVRRDRTLGIAFQLSRRGGDSRAGFAFVTGDLDPSLLAHETGHVVGAGHERAIQRSGITKYAHGFVTTASSERVIDVMAYGNGGERMLPFFSSPRVVFNGQAIGDPATADNARTVREFAPLVAAYRQPPPGGPTGEPPTVDLAATIDAKPLRPVGPGGNVSVGVRLANAGRATALGSVDVDLFLSADPVLDDSDVLVGSVANPRTNLKTGKSRRLRIRFQAPAGLAPGSYHVFARASGGPVGGEPNLSNNATGGPTLQVTA